MGWVELQVYGVGGVEAQNNFPAPPPTIAYTIYERSINTPGYPNRFLTVPVAGSLYFLQCARLNYSRNIYVAVLSRIGRPLKYKRDYCIDTSSLEEVNR